MLEWYRQADRKKTPIGRYLAETSSRQFVLEQAFHEINLNAFHREDYLFVMIVRELVLIASVLGIKDKDRQSLKLENLIPKFKTTAAGEGGTGASFSTKDRPLTEEEIARETMIQKANWSALMVLAGGKMPPPDAPVKN